MKIPLVFYVVLCAWSVATAAPVEKIKNERVVAREETVRPGDADSAGSALPCALVFLNDGGCIITGRGKATARAVKRGDVIFREANQSEVHATGSAPLRFVRIEFPGSGDDFVWGMKGFAPDYKLLVENRYVRIYDIHIPAGGSEPQHTHRDRVVVCLSGAKLRHVFPDGRQEDSSIATDDCLWRLGSTHVGNNLGTTPLWVIAIEPK